MNFVEYGMLDAVVDRRNLKAYISRALDFMCAGYFCRPSFHVKWTRSRALTFSSQIATTHLSYRVP
jgi:hypothetical protein